MECLGISNWELKLSWRHIPCLLCFILNIACLPPSLGIFFSAFRLLLSYPSRFPSILTCFLYFHHVVLSFSPALFIFITYFSPFFACPLHHVFFFPLHLFYSLVLFTLDIPLSIVPDFTSLRPQSVMERNFIFL